MAIGTQHPGKVLGQQLEAVGVSPTELARQLRVPANRITQIINGQRGITGDTALRLAHWFGSEPELWMTLQARYDLQIAKAEAGREVSGLPTCNAVARKPDSTTTKDQTVRTRTA